MIKKILLLLFITLISFSTFTYAYSAEPVKKKQITQKNVVKTQAKKNTKAKNSKVKSKPEKKNIAATKKMPPKPAIAVKNKKNEIISEQKRNELFLDKVTRESSIPLKALENLEFQCNEIDPMACYYLAQYYLNKVFLDNISRQTDLKPISTLNPAQITENLNRASKYLNYACNEYVYEACTDLAKLNLENNTNKYLTQKKEVDTSIDFLRRSCSNNIASACAYLGDLSSEGRYEKKSTAQAFKYYSIGCSLQDSVACHNLALSYYKGWGVEVDHELAYLYMDKACRMKNLEACKAMKNS